MNEITSAMKRQRDLMAAKTRYLVANFWEDENGDTNFVSILILLGIALGVAAVFLTFRDQIVTWLNGQMNNFAGTTKTTVKNTSGGLSNSTGK